jgi:hypothetical protein
MFPNTPHRPNTALITTSMMYTRENSHRMGLDYEFCIHGLHSCCSQRYTQSSVIFINKIYTKKNKFLVVNYAEKVFFIKINFMLIINNDIQMKIPNSQYSIKRNKNRNFMIIKQIYFSNYNEYKKKNIFHLINRSLSVKYVFLESNIGSQCYCLK